MRKTLSLLLTALMILPMFVFGMFTTTVSAAPSTANTGSVESGYTPSGTPINSEEEFLAMKEDGDYYLAKDISISKTYGALYDKNGSYLLDTLNDVLWDFSFKGTLDGNGKSVTISVPMFAYLEGATVKNLSVKGTINFRSDSGLGLATHCGSIAMRGSDVTLENIQTNTTVKGYETGKTIRLQNNSGLETVLYQSIFTGGLVGSAFGDLTLKNCENWGSVTALRASGLIGSIRKDETNSDHSDIEKNAQKTYVTFENCENHGKISDDDCYDLFEEQENARVLKVYGYSAGILGYGNATEISFLNCTNTGNVLSTNSTATISSGGSSGGISGTLVRSDDLGNGMLVTYDNCINDGNVIGPQRAGGIGGYSAGDIIAINCVNNGDITCTTNYAAGIISRPGCGSYPNFVCDLVFENCINNGTITSHRQYAGGITGYTQDRLKLNYCLNTGDILAENVTKTSDTSAHGHPIHCAGMLARSAQSVELYYCVNTGNIVSNYVSAGIAADVGSGSINGVSFTGGYNTFFGCLSAGDVVAYNERNVYSHLQDPNEDGFCDDATYALCSTDTKLADGSKGSDGICDTAVCGGRIGIDKHILYYGSVPGAAGILGYSYGSGNKQAPRIFGCGVTANITASHTGSACAFLGYANTPYALMQGNYFTGELSGPATVPVAHQVTLSKDYCLEYATAWIDRADSEKHIKNNYYLAEIKNSGAKRIMNNGSEIDWAGYDCFVTREDIRSGKLCFLANEAAYDFIHVYPFLQKLGVDPFPTSAYYYLTYKGVEEGIEIDYSYWVNEDGKGGYVNELLIPEESKEALEPDDETEPETDPVTQPVTEPVTDPVTQPAGDGSGNSNSDGNGGCGSVVGTSIVLAVIALASPTVIALKKREDEE